MTVKTVWTDATVTVASTVYVTTVTKTLPTDPPGTTPRVAYTATEDRARFVRSRAFYAEIAALAAETGRFTLVTERVTRIETVPACTWCGVRPAEWIADGEGGWNPGNECESPQCPGRHGHRAGDADLSARVDAAFRAAS